MTRTLVLMRHAMALDHAGRDHDRPLAKEGREEAGSAKVYLAAQHVSPDHALVSTALRTRETFEMLGTRVEPQLEDTLYHAGSDTILELIGGVEADKQTLLVLGHAPGIPALVHDLTDPDRADPAAWERVDRYFPTATFAVFEVEADSWEHLTAADCRLVAAHRVMGR